MTRPLRILGIGSLYPPHHFGGYEVIWQAATRSLRARGHEVHTLATTYRNEGVADGDEPGIHRELSWYWDDHEFPPMDARRRTRLERGNRKVLKRVLREAKPDVVVWWAMGGMSLSLLEQVRRAGIPSVGIVGDEWMLYGPRYDHWLTAWRNRPQLAGAAARLTGVPTRVDLATAAHWLFISDFLREVTRTRAGVDPASSAIAHPGIDPARFPTVRAQAWTGRLLYAGRIDERKGIATAIEALATLPPDTTLRIDGGGDAEHQADLQALAERLGVAGQITFARSARDDLAKMYAASDALLFPVTWDEPWGLVPIEAMSVGRPVIATGTGGSSEYLQPGVNSLHFEPRDAAGLASAITALATDADLRARLVEGGHATAARLTEDAFHDAVEQALLEVASP